MGNIILYKVIIGISILYLNSWRRIPEDQKATNWLSILPQSTYLELKLNHLSPSVWPDLAIYWTLGKSTINLPKAYTFLGKFCKGVQIIHFSSEIILGNFYRHLAIFIWSHWSPIPLDLHPKWMDLQHYVIFQYFTFVFLFQMPFQWKATSLESKIGMLLLSKKSKC